MSIKDLKDKHIAVLGMGVEGYSSALYLAQKGAKVAVLDKRDDLEKPQELLDLGVTFLLGADYLKKLSGAQLIVRSPGIKRNLPEILEAEAKGVKVTSQIQLFFDFCPAEIIGVTGTKGKGTTSALIYEMLKKQGVDAYLGGNIGKPPFDFLDTVTPQSKVVLELSSFQLEDLGKSPADAKAMAGKPHIGVMLMTTSEHLGADLVGTQNYHETIEEYVEAKRNMLRFQVKDDFAVINRDYPASNESDIYTDGKVYQVSRERGVMEQGCFVEEEHVVIRIKNQESRIMNDGEPKEEEDVLESLMRQTAQELEAGFESMEIIDVHDIALPGNHNLENVCAAVMAAYLAGVSKEAMAQVLETFTGLEHRLEFVAEVSGVKYYDDSFSTTPETAIAAIQAFTQPEVLILGGSSKNSDFKELGEIIAKSENIRAIIGIGIEWDRIKDEIMKHQNTIFMVEGAKDMETVISAAAKIAQKGDVVLLTPACASFGMFPNYKIRGDQFKEEVKKLQK